MDTERRIERLEADVKTLTEVTRGLIQIIGAVGLSLNHRLDQAEAQINIEGGHHDFDVDILTDGQHYLAENLEEMDDRLNRVEVELNKRSHFAWRPETPEERLKRKKDEQTEGWRGRLNL